MGKKRQSQTYHPNVSQVKRQKQDENAPAFPTTVIKKSKNKKHVNTLLENQMEITVIDYTSEDA